MINKYPSIHSSGADYLWNHKINIKSGSVVIAEIFAHMLELERRESNSEFLFCSKLSSTESLLFSRACRYFCAAILM